MMCSILRRLVSRKINGPRKFCTAAAAVNRELVEPSSPWLMLPPSFIGGGGGGGDMTYNFFSPVKGKVVSFNNRGGKEETDLMRAHDTAIVGSSHGWLALYSKSSRDLFLSNPLSGRRIELPPFSGKPFRDEEVWAGPIKVIISCSPDDDDCRALMILGSRDRVAFCRPGRSNEWSPLGRWLDDPISIATHNRFRLYIDLVYPAAQKKLFGFVMAGICGGQELEGWDMSDPVRPRTVQLDRFPNLESEPGVTSLWSLCIVCGEQPDHLFLVRRYYTHDVKVYRINDGDGELELCSSLDDLVFFVGLNHGLAVKASQFPQLKPNSVYFSDGRNQIYDNQYIGVFDYQNKTYSPVYYPSLDHQTLTPRRKAHPWFTPTLD